MLCLVATLPIMSMLMLILLLIVAVSIVVLMLMSVMRFDDPVVISMMLMSALMIVVWCGVIYIVHNVSIVGGAVGVSIINIVVLCLMWLCSCC